MARQEQDAGLARQFAAAVAHVRAGRGREAEALLKGLAARRFRPAACAQLMGMVEQDRGRPRKALDWLDRAVALDGADPASHANRAQVLVALGRMAEARSGFERALALAPDQAEILCNLGNVLLALGEAGEALARFARAVALRPGLAEAWNGLGMAHEAMGEAEAALAAYARAGEVRPSYAEAFYNQGNALLALGRAAEAVRAYDRALALRPDFVVALTNRGNALLALGKADAALASYDRARELQPGAAGHWTNRATALSQLGRAEEALVAHERAVALAPANADARFGLGMALLEAGRGAAAEAEFATVLARVPAHPGARFGLALVRLAARDFARGWPDYEERWNHAAFLDGAAAGAHARYALRPDRAALRGRQVVVVREQGVGDEVMFASILPDLLRDAAHVAYVGDARLTRLFAASFPGLEVSDPARFPTARLEAVEVVLPVGSLAHAYRRDEAAFPALPYLRASADAAARWRAELGAGEGRLRVGLSWRGGTARTRQASRSVALAALAPILAVPGCDFVSLQYGDVAEEVARCPEAAALRVFPRAAIEDFDDLAGLIGALDVVISVQNTLVHLAGALGVPCLALLPGNPEWRYGHTGARMPWYASVRLLRQAAPGAWCGVIADAAARLQAAARAGRYEHA